MKNLLVNEIFGATIQGEGPAAGRRCAFVRLAICPLECNFCDTWYTWAFTEPKSQKLLVPRKALREDEVHSMTVDDVFERAVACTEGSNMVVISGGEPLAQIPPRFQQAGLQSTELSEEDPLGLLAFQFYEAGIEVHFETAGIRRPSECVDSFTTQYVVSPKLGSSGNKKVQRYKPDVLDFFAASPKADFKFVITRQSDLIEIEHLVDTHTIIPSCVWLMPEGTTPEAIMEKMPMVAAEALKKGYNVSTRLHVLIWGDERGR